MRFFTNYGFYIAGCARPGDGGNGEPIDESRLMVRASLREHLATLKTRFPGVMREAGIQVFLGSGCALRILGPRLPG